MTTKLKKRIPLPSLEKGQVWQIADASLQIDLVGKRLVHYKHYKGKLKRAPISISGKEVLEKYLNDRQAVLVQE